MPQFDSKYSNLGSGYASGLDIFGEIIRVLKLRLLGFLYYLNTERDFRNFEERATPNFAPKHNLSLVTKYWVNKLRRKLASLIIMGRVDLMTTQILQLF